ncbi:hypothetical protein [Gordonia soli]|uniref:Uncharacterized protein n=1 Tax=Gordonia soli NBRC 108243 TaxID=1223545 RepID=M0QJ25_9ACTN|nr:hypothetical protein [Gordonia soli]GAC68439.1 hypothetical protein GS4_15_00890 [Gordonia soli NBRC 108243]
MRSLPRRWYHRLAERRDGPLSAHRATARLSAYVYGNILALAAVVVATPTSVEHGTAVVVVIGTGVTTFFAHVFAEFIAHATISADDTTPHEERRLLALEELRDAVPIASSATFPALILLSGMFDILESGWAVLIAGAIIVVRIASVPLVAERVRGNPLSLRVLVAGLATAGVAALVVLLKVLIGH